MCCLKKKGRVFLSDDAAVMPPHFHTAACRMFKAVTKLVDIWDDAVQKWPQLLGRES